MTEDAEVQPEMPNDGETMLYDYFKHLTSLCLFSLGGVLALAQNARVGLLVAVLLVIGSAAMLSFSGASAVVEARFKGKPLSKYANAYRVGSPILLSVGLGMFLYLFTTTLKL